MKCPHCLENFHESWDGKFVGTAGPYGWSVYMLSCPACKDAIVKVKRTDTLRMVTETMVYPKGYARAPLPAEVPADLAADYREACLVLTDSAKASAALSRRCLQQTLHHVGIKGKDLYTEITQAMNGLPTHLAEAIDAVRAVGNFAAHPTKNTNTGEIVAVEPGEAEWLLEVLEQLFDFYFVQPAKLAAKRDALNAKLADAGKPPMK